MGNIWLLTHLDTTFQDHQIEFGAGLAIGTMDNILGVSFATSVLVENHDFFPNASIRYHMDEEKEMRQTHHFAKNIAKEGDIAIVIDVCNRQKNECFSIENVFPNSFEPTVKAAIAEVEKTGFKSNYLYRNDWADESEDEAFVLRQYPHLRGFSLCLPVFGNYDPMVHDERAIFKISSWARARFYLMGILHELVRNANP